MAALLVRLARLLGPGLLAASFVAAGCDEQGLITTGPVHQSDSGAPVDDGLGPAVPPGRCGGRVCGANMVCVGRSCCPSARACGQSCCANGTKCFANACVEPGKACLSAGDCANNEYCEPGLGAASVPDDPASDAGPATDGVGVSADAATTHSCLLPAPWPGRCLELPARCSDKGAAGGASGQCLPSCEVRPQSSQNLDAVVEWHWGEDNATEYASFVDVWSTPVVGRVADTNCDGKVNELDPPNVIFIAGDAKGTCCQCGDSAISRCHTGVLRVLDGSSGGEIWTLRKAHAGSVGFMGLSLALGDVDGDGEMEIAAVTGEGRLVVLDRRGELLMIADKRLPGSDARVFGWGGGLAIADINGDGASEIAYNTTVYTVKGGKLALLFSDTVSAPQGRGLSLFADLDGDGQQELLVGHLALRGDGSRLWLNADLPNRGFAAVGDFDRDGKPEVAYAAKGKLWVLDGATGAVRAGPLALPGDGAGGPPTIADFDGDGSPEIGVAKASFYSVSDVDLAKSELRLLWKQINHDLSSSVTGSTVFDFDGDGSAEVVYNDECFLWVYDGKTGAVRFATSTTSFTATEASLVADIDGDGRAEMLMIANGASPAVWKCTADPWTKPDAKVNRPGWKPPAGRTAHRGITIWGDRSNRWVGTRTLWNQHTYHVSNICDSRDAACGARDPHNRYGAIPRRETPNWSTSWLNNYRQNVQDSGIFDAPDAIISLRVACTQPLTLHATVRNIGLALLPKGVEVELLVTPRGGGSQRVLTVQHTSRPLFPGQAIELTFQLPTEDEAGPRDAFHARLSSNQPIRFAECRVDNNRSAPARAPCVLE